MLAMKALKSFNKFSPTMSSKVSTDFGIYKENVLDEPPLDNPLYCLLAIALMLCLLLIITTSIILCAEPHSINLDRSHKTGVIPAEKIVNTNPSRGLYQPYQKPFEKNQQDYKPQGFSSRPTHRELNPAVFNRANLQIIQEVTDSAMELSNAVEDNTRNRINHIFYKFKPVHPGEINLLANSGLRFAPTSWKAFNTDYDVSGEEGDAKKLLSVFANVYLMKSPQGVNRLSIEVVTSDEKLNDVVLS
ncbi:uncharacterized protein [Euwallacea fornicatus]|uniref:uncharacterized protein n=1 Tax=Euwallacea fornicatus TaxID=995702 RepID=UPI00338F881A